MSAQITIENDWHIIAGHAFGFNQSTLVGSINLAPSMHERGLFLRDSLVTVFANAQFAPAVPSNNAELCAVLLDSVLEIQNRARAFVFETGRLLELSEDGTGSTCRLALPFFRPAGSFNVLRWLVEAVNILNQVPQLDAALIEKMQQSLHRFVEEQKKASFAGVNMARIVPAAFKLGIPVRHVESQVFLLGVAKHGRLFNSTITESTTWFGTQFARSKITTAMLLSAAGLPAVKHELVSSADHAVQAANKLTYPVVVKPADKDGGVGVYAGLKNEQEVRQSYELSRQFSNRILLEKFVEGQDYRITVVNGKVVKAIVRKPGGVVGDGQHTIRELIHIASQDEQALIRARERGKQLLSLDEEAMAILHEHALSPESILASGQSLALRKRANVSTGGTTENVIHLMHPDNVELAIRATQLLRLDLSGIDLIIPDISVSWMDCHAAICEINAQPQISHQFVPTFYDEFLRESVPHRGRVPLVLLAYRDTPPLLVQQISDLIARFLSEAGLQVFHTKPEGTFLGERCLSKIQGDTMRNAKALQLNQSADAAVLLVSEDELLAHGLPFVYCDFFYWLDRSEPSHADSLRSMLEMCLPHIGGAFAFEQSEMMESSMSRFDFKHKLCSLPSIDVTQASYQEALYSMLRDILGLT